MTPKRAWRVAVLGAGRMGLAHADAWLAAGGRAEVVVASSRRPASWAVARGVETVADFRAVIERPDVDVVDICLPTPLHRAAAEQALSLGKHVLLEKPIALDLEDAAAIVSASLRSSGQFMVAHVVRFFAGYRLVRDIIDSGRLGVPLAASAARLHAGSADITWIRDVAQSGGVTVDLLVHDYDQLNAILGTARTAYARVIAERSVHVLVEYGNGCVADVSGSTAMPPGYRFSTLLRVRCAGGVIEYATGELGDGEVVRIWPHDGGAEQMPVQSTDAYAQQARYFLRCLDIETPVTEGTGSQALDAVALAAAALRSSASGKVEAVGR